MIDPKGRARVTAIVAAVIGLALATAVIGYFNFGSVLSAIRPIGVSGFLLVAGVQVSIFGPLGLAWWLAAPGEPSSRIGVFVWGRLMREAASDVLPFSQIGGLVIAARAVVLGGVSTAVSFGSNVVDITMEVIAQLIFTLVGVALLIDRLGFGAHKDKLLAPLIGGLLVGSLVAAGMIATQRRGLAPIERFLHQIAPTAGQHATAVTSAIEAAYEKPPRLWGCLALHLFAWFSAATGSWLIVGFIGHPLPFLSMVAIESLLFAIRNAAFVVPSGLGVQEGAYVLLGPLFGLPPEAALALSLIKRGRDICIGVPMLLSWQAAEARQPVRAS